MNLAMRLFPVSSKRRTPAKSRKRKLLLAAAVAIGVTATFSSNEGFEVILTILAYFM
jgi:hypothetical protein